MKNDRVTAGAISGAIGAVIQNIYGSLAKAVGITDISFVDFAEAIIFNQKLDGISGFIAGTLSHLAFGSMLGVLFGYLISKSSSKYYYFKALGFGIGIWFWSLAIGTMYKINVFDKVKPVPALSIFVGALVYGFVTGYVLKIMERRSDVV